MSQEIKYQKIYKGGIGVDTTKDYQPPSKQETINKITSIPAVVLRGHLDHLIIMDTESSEPRLKWNLEALNIMDEYSLIYLLSFIKKRYESEEKKGVLSRPITKHTYTN